MLRDGKPAASRTQGRDTLGAGKRGAITQGVKTGVDCLNTSASKVNTPAL